MNPCGTIDFVFREGHSTLVQVGEHLGNVFLAAGKLDGENADVGDVDVGVYVCVEILEDGSDLRARRRVHALLVIQLIKPVGDSVCSSIDQVIKFLLVEDLGFSRLVFQ